MIPLLKNRRATCAAVLLASSALTLMTTAPAAAAATFTLTDIHATVTGSSVTASVTVVSSAVVSAELAGVCARDSDGRDVDFPDLDAAQLTSSGTTFLRTATFASGTYTYFACVLVDGNWIGVGSSRSFTVSSTPAPEPTSSAPMPVGNLPGWKQVFTEDFTTPLARGSFPGAYGEKWLSYDDFTDTSKVGDYDQSIISAHDGNLDLYLHTENGRPRGAAPVPLVNGEWGGQRYGRFSVRMKADAVDGYGTGFLLWSDNDNWSDGEIDFPESALSGHVRGFNHCLSNPSRNCLVVESSALYAEWHTYTIDWTPTRLDYLIDGEVVGTTTSNIPSQSLHWVMQVGTTGDAEAAAGSSGHVLIDWATIYERD